MSETHRLAYVGDPGLASLFAQMLQEEGLTVDWSLPDHERRGLSDFAEGVAVGLVVEGTKDALVVGIKAATAKFRSRFPQMKIHDETDPTVTDEDSTTDG